MRTEETLGREIQPIKVANGFEEGLKLMVDGEEVKHWGAETRGKDVGVEITREQCQKIANGKPWVLLSIDMSAGQTKGDSPAMWEGVSRDEAWKMATKQE